jgi:hypothetical protein
MYSDSNIREELCPADQLIPSNISTVLSLSDELNTLILPGCSAYPMLS